MGLRYLSGDIFLTRARAIAVGINATGRLEAKPLHTTLHDRYPVFVSECQKRGRAGLLTPGRMWVWRESAHWIVGLVVRETPQGATRQRYVEAAMLSLLKGWDHEGLQSVALMRLGDHEEWPQNRVIVEHYLSLMKQPVTVYDAYVPGHDVEAQSSGTGEGEC